MDLASSIAGLIGLAGLAVQSATTLYTFYHKLPRVAGELLSVISEIQRLSQTLQAIQQLISDRVNQILSTRTDGLVSKLREEITQCTAGLKDWQGEMGGIGNERREACGEYGEEVETCC